VIDLIAEIMPAAWAMTHGRYQNQMAAADVSPVAIYGTAPRLHGHFGPARVRFHGDLYEPDPDGKEVFLIGVSEHPDELIIDIVAFQPSKPNKWWLRLGNAVVLGLHDARLALFEEKPVFVHATPLDWLRNDCRGCVVLDWKADLLSYLPGDRILATDHATTGRLEQAFRRHIHIPQVRVLGGAET